MIVAMEASASQAQIDSVCSTIEDAGLKSVALPGGDRVAIGIVSAIPPDLRHPLADRLLALPGVDHVIHVSRPYKLASREFHSTDTVVEIKGVQIGGKAVTMIAGPCSAENPNQMLQAAKAVKAAGGKVLRGSAFKPRTSPYSFQGLGSDGVSLLVETAREVGLLSVCEVLDESDVEVCSEVDFLQIGARNMQNYRLLTAVGRTGKPVILKRGIAATIDEWLLSAEYILCQDNPNVILCERGIYPLDKTYTRYTLDVSAIPVAKYISHLPVIVDPSHAAGDWKYVSALARAGIAAGADGLIVEIHPCPAEALCDGPQALRFEVFNEMCSQVAQIATALGRTA